MNALEPRRVRRFTDGVNIGVLTRIFHRDLVDEVLVETGSVERRSRSLPARFMVYYVLALCLFFDDAYEEVMRKLVNGLRFLDTWIDEWKVPTTGAISQARDRLGEEPFAELFERVARPLARPGTRGAWFRGWRVMAVDGVVLDVADTPANVEVFHRKPHKDGESVFPQVRLVGLGECGTHAIVGAAMDSWKVYERELLKEILYCLEPEMLVLADRGFYSYEVWQAATTSGAQLVWRVGDNLDVPVLERFPDGSFRSELLPKEVKADLKRGTRRPGTREEHSIPVRVVEYMVTNRGEETETIRLITSIVDPDLASAEELAALYCERWEFELTLDEVETHQMPASKVLRSRKPELVRQEIWALLLTHYAVRSFMCEAADDLGEDPDRLSFIRSIRVVRRQVHNQAGFSPSAAAERDAGNNQRD